jgi:hypothetical protein
MFVHAQSMFCAHFLFKFVSFFCLFISVYFIAFVHIIRDLFVYFQEFHKCFTFTHNSVHARVIFTRNSFKQGCIYVDPLYYLFISELFQCSLHNAFFVICSLAIIAFNFKFYALHLISSLCLHLTGAPDLTRCMEYTMMSSHALS